MGTPVSSSQLQTKILRRKTTPEEYRVYRAALEWDLTDPIVIETRDDLKSEYRWRDRLKPYHHQGANLITFCRRLPVTLLADDVGLGKTISAGLIMSELISRSRLHNVLIVCPKLLGPQWQEELHTKFNIPSTIAIGRDLIAAEPEDTGAVITTYNTARLHLDSIPQDRFQMLVLDEAHKLRNLYGVEKPPQVARRFRAALEERRFRFVLMLTATPIQNRLWDLYSLVDLLTVARGHQNPFGSEGLFARKFIADSRERARQLKTESRDEFRSIVYGYMSRVRRGDAKLYFPDRVVQMHKVEPTAAELHLIKVIAEPIQQLNRLSQISILQALTSSPEALMAQLDNMARKGTVPQELASSVRTVVTKMPTSAKLNGLGVLIDKLMREDEERWRLVVFTGRLETQTTIQCFLERKGLTVGIINGDSGSRNQETIARFRSNPPNCHVVVSTEAGSEGVNLQVANVLVNYDLPWNPMIVEQRIGRIQRLGGEHKSVGIFNIMLRGTFEEYIVGRLMEKLQMASHAIGDIEALLGASGIGDEDESGEAGFDEKIRELVVAALAGKDVEAETRQAEQSIANAKNTLEIEEKNINAMLGSMDGAAYVGPRAPTLPAVIRSMDSRDFVLAAFKSFGARITPQPHGVYLLDENSGPEHIRFEGNADADVGSTLYTPGSAAFLRLVSQVVATGIHEVDDLDTNPVKQSDDLIRQWIQAFGGVPAASEINRVHRCFEGMAIVRVRATVSHDSYERLIEVPCSAADHRVRSDRAGLGPLPRPIENPRDIGLNTDALSNAAEADAAIAEFRRFYLERGAQEMRAAGEDERKRKKLEDDFTPRLGMTLVALEGKLYRQLEVEARYTFDSGPEYISKLTVVPKAKEFVNPPEFAFCSRSGKSVPKTCLKQCQISGALVLQHLLVQSEISSRLALPEFTLLCSLSGKRVLKDEVELSSVSGQPVASVLLKTSALSGKRAEPSHFGECEFSKTEVLNSELEVSEISGKRYRVDQQMRSCVSGKTGHNSEFLICSETKQPLLAAETEQCEVTGKYVMPGILEQCAITHKRVLPSELECCAVTGKRALRTLLVTSSVSGIRMLEEIAITSVTGEFCSPDETKPCVWSGRRSHPDDLRICELTGLSIHVEFAAVNGNTCLQPLVDLIAGIKRSADGSQLWEDIAMQIAAALKKRRCHVESAILSPDGDHLAICCEVRTLLGFRVHQAALVYAITEHCPIGRIVEGQRIPEGWSQL